MHVAERDILRMTDVERPGRQFAEHAELGVFLYMLRHVAQPPCGHIRHSFRGASRMGDRDVLQYDILNVIARNTADGRRVYVVEIVHFRSAKVVVDVRPSEGYLYGDVGQTHVLQDALALASALAEPEEDGIARVDSGDAVHVDIVDFRSVHALDGDGRTEGVEDADVADVYVAETAIGG